MAGCGGTSSGLVPVDSPLIKYQPPPAPDLAGDEPDAPADPAADDWGGLDDDDDDAATPPPVKPDTP